MDHVVSNKDLMQTVLAMVDVHSLLMVCSLVSRKWNQVVHLVFASDLALVSPRSVFQHFVAIGVVRNESLFVRLLKKHWQDAFWSDENIKGSFLTLMLRLSEIGDARVLGFKISCLQCRTQTDPMFDGDCFKKERI